MIARRRPVAGVAALLLLAGVLVVVARLLETDPEASPGVDPVATPRAPATIELPSSTDAEDVVPASLAGAPAETVAPPPAATSADQGPRRHLLVVDQKNHAVAGALVETWRKTGYTRITEKLVGPPTYTTLRSTRTDATGRCAVVLADKDEVVVASRDDVGCSGLRDAAWLDKVRDASGESALTLLPPLEIEGWVFEADETPVAGAVVRLRPNGSDGEWSGPPREAPPMLTEK